MKSYYKIFWAGWIVLGLAGCGAHSPSILKEDQRTIHISVFHNETQQYALEERLTHAMIAAFQRDGRLKVVPASAADVEMNGVIQVAQVSPVGYTDLDRAVGYNMQVTVEVSVRDQNSGDFLIEKRPFHATGTFLLTNEPAGRSVQDVTDHLAEQVLSALIEGW